MNSTLTTSSNKKFCIVFYCGYSPQFNDRSSIPDTRCYGSELATRYLACEFLKQIPLAEIHIFCDYEEQKEGENRDSNGLYFHNYNNFQTFQTTYWKQNGNKAIDVLIVSRYIHFFLEFVPLAEKIFFWMHDIGVQPYWRGQLLPDGARPYFVNVLNKFHKIIMLSEAERNWIVNDWIGKCKHYSLSGAQEDKFKVIGNGLSTTHFSLPSSIKRIPNRFIYCSDPSRGLKETLDCFEKIQEQIPDASLYIYYKLPEEPLLTRIQNMKNVYAKGKITQEELAQELQASEIWFYPTSFFETYCMSALEAQAAGTLCVATKYGAVQDTLGEGRGILIEGDPTSTEWQQEAISKTIQLLKLPEEEKQKIREGAQKWAFTQTWEKIADQWIEYFE